MKNVLADTKLMLEYIWNTDKSIFIFKAVGILINTAQLLLGTLYIKWIVDSIVNNGELVSTIKLIIALQLLTLALYSAMTLVERFIVPDKEYRIRHKLQNLFISKAMKHDLECYENPSFYDNYTKAIRVADTKALDFLDIIAKLVQNVLAAITMLSIVSVLSPVLFVFILADILLSIYDKNKSERLAHERYESEQSLNRRLEYTKKIAHHRQYAKEVRVFGLYEFIIGKLNNSFEEKYELFSDTNRRYWGLKYRVSFVNSMIITPLILIYLTFETLNGNLTVGSFAMLFGATGNIASQLSNIVNVWSDLKFQSQYYVSHLKGVLNYSPKIEDDIINDAKQDLETISSIEFDNICFNYPSHTSRVLDGVTFSIKKGSKVALVGRNGSGKTTLVKLLLRLYDATSGQIKVNGTSIKDYDVRSLRKKFSVVFQDYNSYAFTVGENICLRQVTETDVPSIDEALGICGLREKVQELPMGIFSNISREFEEDGVELSGGEYQRLALARTFVSDAEVLVFDEANSSLDPIAEHDLNEQLMASLDDKTVIFITHRLSTTIMADEIFMLENGSLVERGSHKELLSLNGLYADMFRKQARAYMSKGVDSIA